MAKWQQDEDKRVKLMYEVYDDRVQNIQHKQNMRDLENEEKVQDKELVKIKQVEWEVEEKEKKQKEREGNNQYQSNLKSQIQDKTGVRQTGILAKMEEEKQERLKFLDYEKMVVSERQKGQHTLLQAKRARPF